MTIGDPNVNYFRGPDHNSASSTGDFSGYTCASCGAWVSYGSNIAHQCVFYNPPYQYQPQQYTITYVSQEQIDKLNERMESLENILNRIVDLLEKKNKKA